MMLSVYTGFPGSGKTLHAVSIIYAHVMGKAHVVSNIDLKFPKNQEYYHHRDYTWFQNVENVRSFALDHLDDKYKLLFVVDEAQVIFDSRGWNTPGRMEWNVFFSTHRHYKCDMILITQSSASLDKRVRANMEFQQQHVNVKNASRLAHMVLQFIPDFMFIANKFYANTRERISSSWIFSRRKYTRLYDTFDRDGISDTRTVSVKTQPGV